jgi:hypothetical protein
VWNASLLLIGYEEDGCSRWRGEKGNETLLEMMQRHRGRERKK